MASGQPLLLCVFSEYRICSIRFRIKKWDFINPLPDFEIVGIKFANPITISPAALDTWPDKITIERKGTCSKCGWCCGWRGSNLHKHGCSHVITTGKKKGECSIYANLSDLCSEHGHTHDGCVPPPYMPYHLYTQDCGYSFIVTTPGLPITGNEILKLYTVVSGKEVLPGSWDSDHKNPE